MTSPDDTDTDTDGRQAQTGTNGPQFAIKKIYIKDVSFETPHSPAIFTEEWKPDVNLNISSEASPIGEALYQVDLSVTATVKIGEKTAFLVEVQQAGVFGISGFPDQDLGHMLGSYCPNVLFPYARETVSDLVARGGFPQLLLAPVNFDALYAQHLQRQQASAPGIQ